MGMPISNYTVLKALSSGGGHGEIRSRRKPARIESTWNLAYAMPSDREFNPFDWDSGRPQQEEIQVAQAALAPFNLFAFIIHDPETHPEFHQKISSIFEDLDYTTGDKLLFFALVDPPEEWLRDAANRSYYEPLKSWETETLLQPQNAITSTDTSIAAFSLASSLEMPIGELPCLVITKDFSSHDVHWVKTCPDSLAEQLMRLASATRYENLDLEILKNEIDLCGGSGTEPLNISLADALSDPMSCIISGNQDSNVSHNEKAQAVKRTQNTIKKSYDNLTKLKKENSDESNTEKLYRHCCKISSALALSNPRTLIRAPLVSINQEYLEPYSIMQLKTAPGVLDFLRKLSTDVDYSLGVLCLANVFEHEINLSITHSIRKTLGIELPPYFNKYQKDVKGQHRTGVNFNMQKKGSKDKWLPPSIGQSFDAYDVDCQGKNLDPIEQLLLCHWQTIKDVRNAAAHPGPVSHASFKVVINALNQLSDNMVFDVLNQLKGKYRG